MYAPLRESSLEALLRQVDVPRYSFMLFEESNETVVREHFLLRDLQRQMGLTYIFVAHDLSVVKHISDRVAVMYLGTIAELASSGELYATPRHPYTVSLLSAIPVADPTRVRSRVMLGGDVPSPAQPPSGCHFHPRCYMARPECRHEVPLLREVAPGRWSACHFATEVPTTSTNWPGTKWLGTSSEPTSRTASLATRNSTSFFFGSAFALAKWPRIGWVTFLTLALP